jgi:hypothetical protein
MRKPVLAALAVALVICGLADVSSASAATEFGNSCAGTEFLEEGGFGLISTGNGVGDPLPVAAPTSGVITEWKVNLSEPGVTPALEEKFRATLGQQLIVVQPAGPDRFTVVGKSEASSAMNFNGVSSFPTRIPVKQGDLLALEGSFTVFCATEDPAETLTGFFGTPLIGATITPPPESEETGFGVPVVAKIEPDVDGDGFGDETQDMCPQSAAFQGPCPVVTIGSLPTVQKKAVVLHVATNIAAPISVTATVDLGKGDSKMAQLTAAPQTVTPGSLAKFTLPLTPWTTRVRKELAKNKSLKVSITASATNVTGSPSTSTATAHLRGEAPVHRHKKKPAGHHTKPKAGNTKKK